MCSDQQGEASDASWPASSTHSLTFREQMVPNTPPLMCPTPLSTASYGGVAGGTTPATPLQHPNRTPSVVAVAC